MSEHLSDVTMGALADGELSEEQIAGVTEHLAQCAGCAREALATTLLKSAAANAGRRYAMPDGLQQRLVARVKEDRAKRPNSAPVGKGTRFGSYAWAACAAMLLVCASVLLVQARERREALRSAEMAALVNEVSDQHIAAMAGGAQPEVLSSDRHTVKPWFQGKLAFSFNLPENLPADTALDGADLAYVRGQPTAQLLYHVGRHRVSVFVRASGETGTSTFADQHAGFHVDEFRTAGLEVVAVSDVDPGRLADLARRFVQAQASN